ncbi:uncharacterized protein LOC131944033 [Physella acuta]|uniref:uncharacterized protein LOC131944033 n=1 Tax=Physella acuta TaxID=109671 RepID=UPI0027DAC4CE|nr:uncharacterized protein LOC131944033 [Physella acuta]
MAFLRLAFLGMTLLLSSAWGQATYGTGCGTALEDIPNPASDSCTSFFRCYRNRQYSLRCPLGQAFDFDRSRCRADNEVDCPLQLQRFQAPAVPSYLKLKTPNQDREIEIRVVQVPHGVDPNTLPVSPARGAPATRHLVTQGRQTILASRDQPQTVFIQQPPPAPQAPVLPQGQIPAPAQGQALPTQTQGGVPMFVPYQGNTEGHGTQ